MGYALEKTDQFPPEFDESDDSSQCKADTATIEPEFKRSFPTTLQNAPVGDDS
jgi:hypothetical protein